MVTGSVNELHVYNHHFKWWREVKLAQQAWRREREAERASSEAAGPGEPAEPAGAPPAGRG